MPLNRQIVLGMLRRGNDGQTILEILELIVKEYQEQQSTKNQPTLDPIAFQLIRIRQCELFVITLTLSCSL